MAQLVQVRLKVLRHLVKPLADRYLSLTVTKVSTTKLWAEYSLVLLNVELGAVSMSSIDFLKNSYLPFLNRFRSFNGLLKRPSPPSNYSEEGLRSTRMRASL
jgi:hypothetical protein